MTDTSKLNKQMSDGRNDLQKLNLLDDFLFDVATGDLETCRIMIELSLGKRLRSIRWREGQKVIHNLPGKRGVRLDFCAEDEDGRIFDVEMQKRNEGNIPKRTRFYQAMIDTPLLKSGEKGFDRLNPTYIVIICGFDLFGLGKYRYTFENRCREAPELVLGDECEKIILNTRGKNDAEVEQPLIDFLHYIEQGDDMEIPEECDERLKHLHEKIQDIKRSAQMEATYMRMEERDRLIRESGEIKGEMKRLIQQVCKKLAKSKTPEEIVEELEEELTVVEQICETAKAFAPEYNIGQIYQELEKQGLPGQEPGWEPY